MLAFSLGKARVPAPASVSKKMLKTTLSNPCGGTQLSVISPISSVSSRFLPPVLTRALRMSFWLRLWGCCGLK